MKHWTVYLLLLVTLLTSACSGAPTAAPVAAAAGVETQTQAVSAEGELKPSPSAELSFVQAGVIGEVLVKPGDTVAAGDVLARLVGIETARAELAQAQLEQTLARQALDAMKRGAVQSGAGAHEALRAAQKDYEAEANGWNFNADADDAEDIELAMDDYVETEEAYRDAKEELDRLEDKDEDNSKRQDAQRTFDDEKANLAESYADLLKDLPGADDRLDEQQTKLLSAISALEQARQQVDRLESGLDREQTAAAEARLNAAENHLAAATAALSFYELRAPFAGTVLSLPDLRAGETAQPGQPVIFIAGAERWVVETKDLAEVDVARVTLGQPATVQFDAFPGETFHGAVTAIDPVGREYLNDMTYQVTITLDETDPRFLWNMTATVTVE